MPPATAICVRLETIGSDGSISSSPLHRRTWTLFQCMVYVLHSLNCLFGSPEHDAPATALPETWGGAARSRTAVPVHVPQDTRCGIQHMGAHAARLLDASDVACWQQNKSRHPRCPPYRDLISSA